MQRNENETFEAYKARRAIANEAVKNINAASKGGNGKPARHSRPHKGKIGASYGEALRVHFYSTRKRSTKSKNRKVGH